jgi:hypothetical protein
MALQLLGGLCNPTLAHRSDHVDALCTGDVSRGQGHMTATLP